MQLFHKNNGQKSLVIFFSGWALDYTPFASLFSNKHDLLFVWDYRSTNFEFDCSNYKEIHVAAFSYGVFMSQFVKLPKFNSLTAINGTPIPIDREFGINPRMFDLTLNSLNEKSLEKFYRNMFTDEQQYEKFISLNTTKPDIIALKAELENIKRLSATNTPNSTFTKVIIAQNDRIIPTNSQENYWRSKSAIKRVFCGHFPFFNYSLEELL